MRHVHRSVDHRNAPNSSRPSSRTAAAVERTLALAPPSWHAVFFWRQISICCLTYFREFDRFILRTWCVSVRRTASSGPCSTTRPPSPHRAAKCPRLRVGGPGRAMRVEVIQTEPLAMRSNPNVFCAILTALVSQAGHLADERDGIVGLPRPQRGAQVCGRPHSSVLPGL